MTAVSDLYCLETLKSTGFQWGRLTPWWYKIAIRGRGMGILVTKNWEKRGFKFQFVTLLMSIRCVLGSIRYDERCVALKQLRTTGREMCQVFLGHICLNKMRIGHFNIMCFSVQFPCSSFLFIHSVIHVFAFNPNKHTPFSKFIR